MTASLDFTTVSRSAFRQVFQPSRIVIALLPDPEHGVNPITLCFVTHAAYRPRMIGFAIQRGSRSYGLIDVGQEAVLAVPGEAMVEDTLFFGVESGNTLNKLEAAGTQLLESETVGIPGIATAIANIEVQLTSLSGAGDHRFALARVRAYRVRRGNDQLPLLSLGPRMAGYRLLARNGIHRLGVVSVP